MRIDHTNGVDRKLDYDKEKYKEMILNAAETVLGYLASIGFYMEIRKVSYQSENGGGLKN